MKRCATPDCPAHLRNRAFLDEDVICPQCGEPLEYSNLVAPSPPAEMSSGTAFLLAIGTLLLIFILVGLLLKLGLLHQRINSLAQIPPAGAVPVSVSTFVPGAPQPTRARSLSLTPLPTPIGGLFSINPTAAPALPSIPGPVGGGTGAGTNSAETGPSGSKTISTRLCKVISPGELCQDVTSYKPTDTFYVAVQAIFGSGAVKTIRARLYGPPNVTPLLNEEQSITPNRDGNFWVGFGFSQSTPWTPGSYRADIYVNRDLAPTTYLTWTVVP